MGQTMSDIAYIQPFVQEYAETITDVLQLHVTIIDEDCIRIGGTGPHARSIGRPIPCGSFFRQVIAGGKPGFIYDDVGKRACKDCDTAGYCQELATMGFPIVKQDKTVGVIGVIAFSDEQKQRLVKNQVQFLSFLRHMSSLLADKLAMIDYQRQLQSQVQEVLATANQSYTFGNMTGRDERFIGLLQTAQRVAVGSSTILIRGESGTGKELLAKAIHENSGRRQQAFVVVNCPSIPETLLESELFGYEAGAFTGASKRGKSGKFELADQGTIFLDEIGDLPLSLQPKLLRVIQERCVERISAAASRSVDVRIIAATNRNLEEMVRQGTFREDLYYRLNVIPLIIPPLRQRPADVPLYLEYFLDKFAQSSTVFQLDSTLRSWLLRYHWPGNVRQLENVIEYMVCTASHSTLTLANLPEHIQPPQFVCDVGSNCLEEQVAAFEKQLLVRAISGGNSLMHKKQVAIRLGISLATLYRKLEKYQLK